MQQCLTPASSPCSTPSLLFARRHSALRHLARRTVHRKHIPVLAVDRALLADLKHLGEVLRVESHLCMRRLQLSALPPCPVVIDLVHVLAGRPSVQCHRLGPQTLPLVDVEPRRAPQAVLLLVRDDALLAPPLAPPPVPVAVAGGVADGLCLLGGVEVAVKVLWPLAPLEHDPRLPRVEDGRERYGLLEAPPRRDLALVVPVRVEVLAHRLARVLAGGDLLELELAELDGHLLDKRRPQEEHQVHLLPHVEPVGAPPALARADRAPLLDPPARLRIENRSPQLALAAAGGCGGWVLVLEERDLGVGKERVRPPVGRGRKEVPLVANLVARKGVPVHKLLPVVCLRVGVVNLETIDFALNRIIVGRPCNADQRKLHRRGCDGAPLGTSDVILNAPSTKHWKLEHPSTNTLDLDREGCRTIIKLRLGGEGGEGRGGLHGVGELGGGVFDPVDG
mmetsp:Transcript_15138/g.37927  ORF Transcript_15138/g.37927 Transcript_15138/m.37927 type:complete len:451 (-) Transcript_15138:46-1398(-)